MKRFEGRATIVTAAASGIGRAIALRLHEENLRMCESKLGLNHSPHNRIDIGWKEVHGVCRMAVRKLPEGGVSLADGHRERALGNGTDGKRRRLDCAVR